MLSLYNTASGLLNNTNTNNNNNNNNSNNNNNNNNINNVQRRQFDSCTHRSEG